MNQHLKKSFYGIWVVGFVILAHLFFKSFPGVCESVYGQVFYPSLRIILDYTIGLLDIPLVYILILLCLTFLLKFLKNLKNLRYDWFSKILSIINFWAWVVSLFYILWGFNYDRPDLKSKLELQPTFEITERESLFNKCINEIKALPYLRIALSHEIDSKLNHEYKNVQRDLLGSIGYNVAGRPKVKRLLPNGILRRFGISGIYLPFTGQGNIDGSLLNLEYPFIAAHELAHANGITDEGEASLVAYLTCANSSNETLKYSAQIYLLRNLLYQAQHTDSLKHKMWLKKVPVKVKSDIVRIKENALRYPDLFPNLSDQINDAYLKANGIESGSKSYGDLVDLIIAYDSLFSLP